MTWTRWVTATPIFAVWLFIGGCSSTDPGPPVSLRITTITSGENLDPDGYLAGVDGASRPVSPNGSVVFNGLVSGVHLVGLSEVAANCGLPENFIRLDVSPPLDSPELEWPFRVTCFAAPLTGRIAFVSDRNGTAGIYVMNADGSDVGLVTDDPGRDPAWSPDGQQLVFVSNRDGNDEIYTVNADGSSLNRLTSTPAHDLSPTWSPNGLRIAFQSERDGNSEIYLMNADGTGAVNLTQHSAGDGSPTWSPDGTRIAFVSGRCGPDQGTFCGGIYTMTVADAPAATLLAPSVCSGFCLGEAELTWSPDGRRIALSVNYDTIEVLDVSAPDAPRTSVASGVSVSSPAWSPDGTKLAFTVRFGGLNDNGEIFRSGSAIGVANADGSHGVVNLSNRAGFEGSPAWKP
jgi:Tol biopolymer transport system component